MNTAPQSTTETAARYWTLAEIAESQNVIKRTAQGWLAKAKAEHGDIGELINGARHFNVLERDLLISYAAPPRAVRVDPLPRTQQIEAFPEFTERPAEPRSVEIVAGNHRLAIDGPEMPGQIDLAQFRGDISVRSYADPLNEAAAALALFDALETAMDADLDRSFAQLETTTETVQKLQAKAESMAAKQLEYQVTQKILARLQNQKTSELSSLLGKAEALGGGGSQ